MLKYEQPEQCKVVVTRHFFSQRENRTTNQIVKKIMTTIKFKIEKQFERLGHLLFQHRIKTLAFTFIIIIIMGSQIANLSVDTSFEGMLHPSNPERINYNAFRDQFGQDRIIIVTVKPPEIFSQKFINTLKSIHMELENNVPYVKEVRSLINARSTYGENDMLFVDELLKDWPEKNIEMEYLKKLAMQNKVNLSNIISEDGSVAAIVIETEAAAKNAGDEESILDDFEKDSFISEKKQNKGRYFTEDEVREVVDGVNSVLDKYRVNNELLISVTGGPIIDNEFDRIAREDMVLLGILTSSVVIFFLMLLFRRVSGVILPNIVVYSALVALMGLMGFFKMPITVFSNILPSLLMAVGTADSVHVLAIFYRKYDSGSSKEDAIAYALGHSGLAIVMTSVTTAAGLLSFALAEITAIGEMGIAAAIGAIFALFCTIIILPALISVIPIKQKQIKTKNEREGLMDRVLLSFARFSTFHPVKIIAASIIVFIVSVICIFKLNFHNDMMDDLPDSIQAKGDLFYIEKKLKGVLVIEVVVDTKKENGIYDPGILNSIEKLAERIEQIKNPNIFVGKVFSINDILKETNQALHNNNSSFYTIPNDREEIAQEFLLFESSGSDDLERVVDSQFSKTRISIKIPWAELFATHYFIKDISKQFEDEFHGRAEITITGMAALMGKTFPTALRTMAKSYVIAFIVISFLMIILVGSVKLGLISMIPNMLPIIIVIGFMGLVKIPMNLAALLIGSIAIGLVVDDTMHFMYNFRKYYDLTGDSTEAIKETLLGTGRALLITSLVLSANFIVIIFATLKASSTFGCLTAMVIMIALLTDFLLAPALMMIVTKKRSSCN